MRGVKREPEDELAAEWRSGGAHEDAGAPLTASEGAGGPQSDGYGADYDDEDEENDYGEEEEEGGEEEEEEGEDAHGGQGATEDGEGEDLDELIMEDEEELAIGQEEGGNDGEEGAAGLESGELAGSYQQLGGSDTAESDGEDGGAGNGGDAAGSGGRTRRRRPLRRGGVAERQPLVHHCFYCGAQGSLTELTGCGACNVLTFSPCCNKRAHMSCAAKLPGVLLPGFEALGLWFCGKSRKGYPPHTARQYLDAVHGPSNTAGQLRAYLAGRAALQAQVEVAPDGEFFQPGRRIARLARGLVPALPGTEGGRQYVFAGMLPAAARSAAAPGAAGPSGAAGGTAGGAAAAVSPLKRAQSGVGGDGHGYAAEQQLAPGIASPAKRPRRRAAAAAVAGIQADVRADMQPEAAKADPREVLPARPSPGGTCTADARRQQRPLSASPPPPPPAQAQQQLQQPTPHRQFAFAPATCNGAGAGVPAELHLRSQTLAALAHGAGYDSPQSRVVALGSGQRVASHACTGPAAGSDASAPQHWSPVEPQVPAAAGTAGAGTAAAAAAAGAAAELAALRAQLADMQQRLADMERALSEEQTRRIRAEVRAEGLEEQRQRYEQEARDERERAMEARVAEAVMKRQLAELEKKMKG